MDRQLPNFQVTHYLPIDIYYYRQRVRRKEKSPDSHLAFVPAERCGFLKRAVKNVKEIQTFTKGALHTNLLRVQLRHTAQHSTSLE